ncbi:MAG: Rrf2 family transcriptional regulator [Opitutales bacterium]|nr:Rrf2 family transcriptional regulator [Opitutales bacterium]
MKISRKVEYASRVLAQLARCYGTNKMPHIEELANAEDVPANYLVQILNELRSAGLIVSRRGKQGGYMLARAPVEISVADVFKAIDGELLEPSSEVGGQSGRGVSKVLGKISADFEASAASHTIRDIVGADSATMYFI